MMSNLKTRQMRHWNNVIFKDIKTCFIKNHHVGILPRDMKETHVHATFLSFLCIIMIILNAVQSQFPSFADVIILT